MNAQLWIKIIVCLAIIALIFRDKVMKFLLDKMFLNLTKSGYFRWIIGLTVFIVFIIAFNTDKPNSVSNKSAYVAPSELESNTEQAANDYPKEYINGTDAIRLTGLTNNSYDLYTSRELGKLDIQLLREAVNYMGLRRDYTSFLYVEGKEGEDYYAYFDGNHIHPKVTKEVLNENLISELKSGMDISSKGNILSFLDKISKAKSAINSNIANKEELKKALLSFQKIHFPKARKAYYQNAKKELWEKDIEVELSGKNITFIGYHFVANKVIKDTYLEIRDELVQLRFKTVGFKAFDGDDKTYWELDTKNDSEI